MEPWGTVVQCTKGPQLIKDLRKRHKDKDDPPPTIIFERDGDNTTLIMEENGSYPAFLYSVWISSHKATGKGSENAMLHQPYHIESTIRLAEAVVTAVVHASAVEGQPSPITITGGRNFALLRYFSDPDTDLARLSSGVREPYHLANTPKQAIVG